MKRIIDGHEVEFAPLGSQESFHSEDIPSSLLDDSRSINSDLIAMPEEKQKMYAKIKKKREEKK